MNKQTMKETRNDETKLSISYIQNCKYCTITKDALRNSYEKNETQKKIHSDREGKWSVISLQLKSQKNSFILHIFKKKMLRKARFHGNVLKAVAITPAMSEPRHRTRYLNKSTCISCIKKINENEVVAASMTSFFRFVVCVQFDAFLE